MDEYENYLKQFEIRVMPEDYRAVRGKRSGNESSLPLHLTCVRNSFAQINFSIVVPNRHLLITEERPAFSTVFPVEDTGVLRAHLELEGLEGHIYNLEMPLDDDGIRRADVLTPTQVCVKPWTDSQMTCLINIPATAEAGEYTGCIRFYAHTQFWDERLVKSFPFTITVENITLPTGTDRCFHLNLWQHVFNIARKCDVAAYSPEHIQALLPYGKALSELGGRYITVLLSDVPWAGQRTYRDPDRQSDLYEYNFIRIYRSREGQFRCDFHFAEEYISAMMKCGMDQIMFTGLYGIWTDPNQGFEGFVKDWPDAIRLSYIDESDGCIRFMRTREEIEWYYSEIYQWICRNQWLKNSVLMGDEVNMAGKTEGWTAMLDTLHRLMPDIRMEWDNEPASMLSEEYAGERLDVYTPGLDMFFQVSEEDRLKLRARLQPNGKMMWSNCCWPPLLNAFLYSRLTEVRLHGLITEFAHLEGFLRWNYTVWPENPRDNLACNGWPAGDTCFVYPGHGGQCLLSLRYLALRRGIEDFELCQMLKKKRPDAQQIIDELKTLLLANPDLGTWAWDTFDDEPRSQYFSQNIHDFEKARDILLHSLKEA